MSDDIDRREYLDRLREGLHANLPLRISPGEAVSLNVVFQLPWEEGCWIVIPDQPWPPAKADRAYLSPGEHILMVSVTTEVGVAQVRLRVISPPLGGVLRVEPDLAGEDSNGAGKGNFLPL